jgi:adenine-specific DNA-methyltransferase
MALLSLLILGGIVLLRLPKRKDAFATSASSGEKKFVELIGPSSVCATLKALARFGVEIAMGTHRNEVAAPQPSIHSDSIEVQPQPVGYASLEDRKSTGAHYTPKVLADFVAGEIAKVWGREPRLGSVRVLDPAVGDGELLLSILEELTKHGYSNVEVVGFDTDRGSIELAIDRVGRCFPQVSLQLKCEDFLDFVLMYGNDDLFGAMFEPCDLVIANPPYVRTQVMGAEKAQELAQRFKLSGRVDLYYAFILGIARLLRPGGIAGIIVSNRFMTTKSGAFIRRRILEELDVLHVWDLGDTRLFEASVLPAVLLVERKSDRAHATQARFTSIYSVEGALSAQRCFGIAEALNQSGLVRLSDDKHYLVRHGRLDHGEKLDGVWRIATEASERWLGIVEANTYCKFGDVGQVRVGVKTTADKVFIRSDWDDLPEEEQPELLRPLITHHIARRFKALRPDKQRQILYTHQVVEGKRIAVNLDEFPRAARYLNRHRSILEKREYVLKAGRKWFEVWVPQDPDVWTQPKVVFRDIVEKPTFWMDLSGAVVNGDCYWLACKKPEQVDLLWLILAVGNSSFLEMFYDHRFNNKLYARRRRFMTQYAERFPLPDPETSLSERIVCLAKQVYDLAPAPDAKDLEEELDQLVWRAFGFAEG